jgi:hypothetical protein
MQNHERQNMRKQRNNSEPSALKKASRRTEKAVSEEATASKADAKERSVSPEKIVEQIRAEQQKIARNEGRTIECYIAIGLHFAELKALASRRWAKHLKPLGYSARATSRLMKIGNHWGSEIGPLEAEILDRLPPDAHKCESLCRLGREQLLVLLGKLDCRKASRKEVSEAVSQELGEEPLPPKPAPPVADQVGRKIEQISDIIEEWRESAPTDDLRQQLLGLLTEGFEGIRGALTAGDRPSGPLNEAA